MRLIHLLICLLLAGSVWGQQSARVRELEKQRKETLEEIRKTGELLKQTQATEKDVTRRLKLISQQILSRKKVISLLNQEMEAINIQITDMGKQIRVLENQLQQKKESYGKSVRSMYRRHASQDKLLFILSAEASGSRSAGCVTSANMPSGRNGRLPISSPVSRRSTVSSWS